MKYKIGDKVTLTDGNIMTIDQIDGISKWYRMREDPWNCYKDEMIEGLAEELLDKEMEEHQRMCDEIMDIQGIEPIEAEMEEVWHCPEGYIFKDENGNVINATKIVLEKKKKEYPKTYEECKRIMGVELWNTLWGEDATEYEEQTEDLIDAFIRLKVCRDAYWRIAGKEMGLGKPWSPSDADYITGRYCIFVHRGNILCDTPTQDCIFTFPTDEMRDAFKENFDPDIEICKELL